MKHFLRAFILYTSTLLASQSIFSAATDGNTGGTGTKALTCHGEMINPIDDVCWKCIFPISIGAIEVFNMGGMRDIKNPASPICVCPIPVPPYFRVGLTIGFWEPVRISEAVRKPYCFPSLGGQEIDTGTVATGGGTNFDNNEDSEQENNAFYQIHWYKFPIMYILEMITDSECKTEDDGFDIAYMTELDPTWNDSETSFIITPEAILFANPIAVAACALDCVQATRKVAINAMFWCAGCQGTVYPMVGHMSALRGKLHAGLLGTIRLTAKLARLRLTKITSGTDALCATQSSLIFKKNQYRTQQVYPKPQTGDGTFCCNPYGADSTVWSPGHQYPYKGEDFAYLIWRKRNCCLSF